jgi:hypothetical protein
VNEAKLFLSLVLSLLGATASRKFGSLEGRPCLFWACGSRAHRKALQLRGSYCSASGSHLAGLEKVGSVATPNNGNPSAANPYTTTSKSLIHEGAGLNNLIRPSSPAVKITPL